MNASGCAVNIYGNLVRIRFGVSATFYIMEARAEVGRDA